MSVFASMILMKDGYKADHRSQYPKGTTKVYSNFTPRISRMEGVDKIVVFGIQYFVKRYLVDMFNKTFFMKDEDQVCADYQKYMDNYLGPGAISTDHIRLLHQKGYLPIHLKALPEGTLCPLKTPVLTITNTDPNFEWLPNFLETLLSNVLWHPMTVATIAYEYRKSLEAYAAKSSDVPELVKWQGHDFSMRGNTSLESSIVCGGAHLTSFTGTDTIPAIPWLEKFYGAQLGKEIIGGSVPATEHSVMCLGGKETEFETYKRLITEVYPKGFVSIVSDTWNYWDVLNTTVRDLKPEIMARDGKVVIRPDSGDPELILCGDGWSSNPLAKKGSVQLLWEIFGGTINSKGFKQLDQHIGLIYGDSITPDRQKKICANLYSQGFASTNVVFGIGSYTYQYNTRDTFGFAMKATYGEVAGQALEIFKDPFTDGGVKKSAKGLLCVKEDLSLEECVSWEEENTGLLQTVFKDGERYNETTLSAIREKIDKSISNYLTSI